MKKCNKCNQTRDLSEFYACCSTKDGYENRCKDCDRKIRGVKKRIPKGELIQAALKLADEFDCYTKFKESHPKEFKLLSSEAILPKLKHLKRKRLQKLTEGDCFIAASKCENLLEFRTNFNSYYQKATRCGFLHEIRKGFSKTPRSGGFKRSTFIKMCNAKGGFGTLYLIKCTGNSEYFYKIGITSDTVEIRYKKPSDLPYNYSIMWEITGDPGYIFDLEKKIIRETKKFRYQPDLWLNNSHETFKW